MVAQRGQEETTLQIVDRRLVRLPTLSLVATQKDGSERPVPLQMNAVVIGTAPDCELVVDDVGVSRRHCVVTLTARGVLVRDLRSKNGTWMGGAETIEGFLSLGGVVKIGSTTIRLQIAGPPRDVPLWPGASYGDMLGGSIAMRALFSRADAVAGSSCAVVLRGEIGTGKGLLGRALHAASKRAEGPFVVFDEEHDDAVGEAEGGTLFVDELLDVSPRGQAKLLLALDGARGRGDDMGVGARLVTATSMPDVDSAVEKGLLRRDLYFRLAAVELRLPPLRERREDIELLAEHFLARGAPPRRLPDLPPGALAMLNGHDWPGNVRELENAVTRLVLFPHLGPAIFDEHGILGDDAPSELDRLLALPLRDARDRVVERFEAQYLSRKLEEHQGNVSKVAAAVGMSRQMVHRLLARHGIGSREP